MGFSVGVGIPVSQSERNTDDVVAAIMADN